VIDWKDLWDGNYQGASAMNKVISSIAAATAFVTTCIAAQAADLPMEPAYKAPVVVQQVYNWTGFYIGVNGGYAWGSQDPFNILTSRFDAFSVPFSGGMFGGTAGAQIQSGHVVIGVEADIDWARINGSATVIPTIGGIPVPAGTAALTTNIHDVSTGRLRVGYALDNWLLYATAGLALLGANSNVSTVGGLACTTALLTAVCSGTDHRLGATAGLGLEYGITPAISAKFEYLYTVAASLEVSHLNEVRVGLNYRFGGL
jgi:outer membrane immunogenic protein